MKKYNIVVVEVLLDVCCIDVLLNLERALGLCPKRNKIGIPRGWWAPLFKGSYIVIPIGPLVESFNEWLVPPFDRTPYRKAYIHGISCKVPASTPGYDRMFRYIVNHPLGYTSYCILENWIQQADGTYFLRDEYEPP